MEFTTFEKLYSYNTDKTVKEIKDTKTGSHIIHEYDESSRLIKKTDGQQIRVYSYDSKDRIIHERVTALDDSFICEAFTTYNELGDIVTATLMNGVIVNHRYDSAGRILSTTNSLGDNTTYTYTEVGRDVLVIENGNTTQRIQKKFKDREGVEIYQSINEIFSKDYKHTMEYNEFGELTRFVNQTGFEYTKTYNSAGKELSYKSKYQEITYEYDENNALIKQFNNGELMYEYIYLNKKLITSKNVPSKESKTYSYNEYGLVSKIVSVEQVMEDPFKI